MIVSFPARKSRSTAGQFVGGNIRQKPQLSQIHGDDRQLPAAHLMHRPQDRAVAAQHNGHVGVELREVLGGVEIGGHDLGVRARFASAGGGPRQPPRARSAALEQHHPQGAFRRRRGHWGGWRVSWRVYPDVYLAPGTVPIFGQRREAKSMSRHCRLGPPQPGHPRQGRAMPRASRPRPASSSPRSPCSMNGRGCPGDGRGWHPGRRRRPLPAPRCRTRPSRPLPRP